jgi:hypothetical protein
LLFAAAQPAPASSCNSVTAHAWTPVLLLLLLLLLHVCVLKLHVILLVWLFLQAERLEELQERLAVPYDGLNPAHQEQLRELWALAFPGQPCEALKTPKWKEMGWQVGEGKCST